MPLLLPKRLAAAGTPLIGRTGPCSILPGAVAVLPGRRRIYRTRGGASPWPSDDFNRANADPLDGNWTARINTWLLESNTARRSSGPYAEAEHSVALPSGDATISARILCKQFMAFYLYGRYVAGTGNCTGYSAIVSANGGTLGILVLAKWVPDYTVLGRYTFSEPAGDIPESTMELVMNGSDLSLKWNGTTRVTVSDATYANSRTGAAIGVYDNYTGESWLDTWQTGAVT